jgi:hypothetical protein
MERNRFFNYSSLHQKLSLLLSKLPKRSAKRALTPEALKTSRGLAFLFLLFAWISISATESEATSSYLRNHWPKASTWQQTLAARGLVSQKNLGDFANLLKTHPRPFAKESTIWTSLDGCMVYLSESPFRSGPELWTCESKPQTSTWRPLGEGLSGFEKLIDFFEITPLKARAAPRKMAYKIDPREFHY